MLEKRVAVVLFVQRSLLCVSLSIEMNARRQGQPLLSTLSSHQVHCTLFQVYISQAVLGKVNRIFTAFPNGKSFYPLLFYLGSYKESG